MCKVCKAFEMEPGQARIDHLRRLEFVEAFGPQWKGKDLFEYDEGNRFLCRCPECDALVLKQSKDMGFAPVFFGCDGMDGILNLEGFDTSLAEGLMLLTPFAADADDELTKNFVAEYQKRYNEIPIQFGADAYDGMYAFKAAAEKANLNPEMSVEEIGTAMMQAMTEISIDGLTGEGISWDASGSPTKAPKAVVIENGAYKSAE